MDLRPCVMLVPYVVALVFCVVCHIADLLANGRKMKSFKQHESEVQSLSHKAACQIVKCFWPGLSEAKKGAILLRGKYCKTNKNCKAC
eukprot:4600942-Amphidinium_carterae.1